MFGDTSGQQSVEPAPFFLRIVAKRKTTMGLFDFFKDSPEKKLGRSFDEAVRVVDEKCGGEPMLSGVMTFHAISKTYASLKQNREMIQRCGLDESEYLRVLDKVMNKKGREYISNWDQMMNNKYTDY